MPWNNGIWVQPGTERRKARAWWNPRILWISVSQLIKKLWEKFNG